MLSRVSRLPLMGGEILTGVNPGKCPAKPLDPVDQDHGFAFAAIPTFGADDEIGLVDLGRQGPIAPEQLRSAALPPCDADHDARGLRGKASGTVLVEPVLQLTQRFGSRRGPIVQLEPAVCTLGAAP